MSGLKVINMKDVKGERREPPRTSWILVSEKMVGSQNLAVGYNKTHPGGMVPEHKHEIEEEVMFFISGQGKFITENEEISHLNYRSLGYNFFISAVISCTSQYSSDCS